MVWESRGIVLSAINNNESLKALLTRVAAKTTMLQGKWQTQVQCGGSGRDLMSRHSIGSMRRASACPSLEMKLKPMRIAWIFSLVLFGAYMLPQTPPVNCDSPFNAQRLQPGTFRYSDSIDGKVVGESKIRVQRSEGGHRYVFSNVVEGASDQHWKAAIDPCFHPISAELTFGGGGEQHKAFELSYARHHVSGLAGTRSHNGFVDRHIDEDIAADTVDQRIDWAAVMARKSYKELETFTFHVYDPKDGNSRIVATVERRERIHTRAGEFGVIRILYRTEKAGGAQTFEVYITEQAPRFLVKEVFPWGMTSELVESSQP